jgi:hypothetical protein
MQLRGGGTVTLDLDGSDQASVRYRAQLTTPAGQSSGTVSVALTDGTIVFAGWTGDEPPPWLLDYARQFLRGAWRARATTPWPARIHRWRDAR